MPGYDDCFFDYVKESIRKLNRVSNTLKKLLTIRENEKLYDPEEYETVLSRTVNQAITENEVSYLYIRPITSRAWNSIKGLDGFKTLSQDPDQPKYQLIETEDGYELTLPPLISKHTKNRCLSDGMAIRKLVTELFEEYKIEKGQSPQVFCRAVLEFTHFVAESKLGYAAPDPDNLDIKAVIDTLQNKLIRNDTVLDITLIQKGMVAPVSYTRLAVKRVE